MKHYDRHTKMQNQREAIDEILRDLRNSIKETKSYAESLKSFDPDFYTCLEDLGTMAKTLRSLEEVAHNHF